jgi:hypothetical protein
MQCTTLLLSHVTKHCGEAQLPFGLCCHGMWVSVGQGICSSHVAACTGAAAGQWEWLAGQALVTLLALACRAWAGVHAVPGTTDSNGYTEAVSLTVSWYVGSPYVNKLACMHANMHARPHSQHTAVWGPAGAFPKQALCWHPSGCELEEGCLFYVPPAYMYFPNACPVEQPRDPLVKCWLRGSPAARQSVTVMYVTCLHWPVAACSACRMSQQAWPCRAVYHRGACTPTAAAQAVAGSWAVCRPATQQWGQHWQGLMWS